MRKRRQYASLRSQSRLRLPTIVIMTLILLGILFFRNEVSQWIAQAFAPQTPRIDAHAAPTSPAPTTHDSHAPLPPPAPALTGTVLYQANKNASQRILLLLSQGRQP
ncbi:MAG: hypothetical protein FWC40_00530 [Proteobacteria bacterium]|nr:hypothetical protein [Pseudomonadota bacterium]